MEAKIIGNELMTGNIHHATKNRRYLLHLFDGFELNEDNYFEAPNYDEAYRLALPVIADYTEYQMSEL